MMKDLYLFRFQLFYFSLCFFGCIFSNVTEQDIKKASIVVGSVAGTAGFGAAVGAGVVSAVEAETLRVATDAARMAARNILSQSVLTGIEQAAQEVVVQSAANEAARAAVNAGASIEGATNIARSIIIELGLSNKLNLGDLGVLYNAELAGAELAAKQMAIQSKAAVGEGVEMIVMSEGAGSSVAGFGDEAIKTGVGISKGGAAAIGATAALAVSAPILYAILGDEIGGLSKVGFINNTNEPVELQNFIHRKGRGIKDFDHLNIPVEGVIVPAGKGVKIGEVDRGAGSSDQTYTFEVVLPKQVSKERIEIDLFEGAVRVEHRPFHSNIDYSADTDPDTPITPTSDTTWYTDKNKNVWYKKVGNKIYELSYEIVTKGNDSVMFILNEK